MSTTILSSLRYTLTQPIHCLLSCALLYRNIDEEKAAMIAKAQAEGEPVVGNYATYDQVLITGVSFSPFRQWFKFWPVQAMVQVLARSYNGSSFGPFKQWFGFWQFQAMIQVLAHAFMQWFKKYGPYTQNIPFLIAFEKIKFHEVKMLS